jgi:hypothetical protein
MTSSGKGSKLENNLNLESGFKTLWATAHSTATTTTIRGRRYRRPVRCMHGRRRWLQLELELESEVQLGVELGLVLGVQLGDVQLEMVLGGVLRGVLGGVLELELEVELGVQLEVQQPEVQDQLGTLTTTGRARYRGHAGRRTRAGSVPLKKLSKGAAAAAAAAGRLAPPLPESQCVSRTVSVASQWISIGRLGLERSSPTGSWTLR